MESFNAATSVYDSRLASAARQVVANDGEMPEQVQTKDGNMDSVSRDALLLTEALRIAHNTPDVRGDKVNSIRAKLAAGTYEIDAGRIAAALLREDSGLFNM